MRDGLVRFYCEAADAAAILTLLAAGPGFEDTVRESSRKDAKEARYWGLYYYYTTAAKALRLLGKDVIDTPEGPKNWRVELAHAILKRQQADVRRTVNHILLAAFVDLLAEVSATIVEADTDERQTQFARGLEMITGEDAQAA